MLDPESFSTEAAVEASRLRRSSLHTDVPLRLRLSDQTRPALWEKRALPLMRNPSVFHEAFGLHGRRSAAYSDTRLQPTYKYSARPPH